MEEFKNFTTNFKKLLRLTVDDEWKIFLIYEKIQKKREFEEKFFKYLLYLDE